MQVLSEVLSIELITGCLIHMKMLTGDSRDGNNKSE